MIQQKSIGGPVKDSIRVKFFSNQPNEDDGKKLKQDKPFPPLRQDSINSQSYQYTPYPKIGQIKDQDENDETGPSKKRVYDSEPAVLIGDTPYFYLNNDILSRNFALCAGFDYDSLPLEHKEQPPTYNVYLCMYAINTDCSLPFLEYFLVKSGGTQYTMPHFEFSCTDEMKALEGSDEHPIQIHFQNQCFEHFLEESHITENMDHLEEYYKGFVSIPGVEGSPIPNRIQPGDHVIVAFFDCTKNKSEMVEKMDGTTATWALLHEIVYKHKVQDIDIEPIVYQFFYEKPETCLIRDEEGFQLMIPRVLYLCKQKGDAGFENVYIDESKDSTQSISMLDDRCEHRLFGYYYYFSARPIDPTYKDVNKLVRYAGFPEHCLYIVRDVGNIKKVVSVTKDDETDPSEDQVLESVEKPSNESESLSERKVGGEELGEKPGPKVVQPTDKPVNEESKEEVTEESKEKEKEIADEPTNKPVEVAEESKEEEKVDESTNKPVEIADEPTNKPESKEPLNEPDVDEDETGETISWSTYFKENDIPYYLFKKTNLFTKLA